jgi:hypothetical protein
LDYFGMRSSQAETMTTIARQLTNPDAADPFSETPVIQLQQHLQAYLNDVFERNHLAKAKYGADVFTKGKIPELIKTRTDAISKFINTIDKLGQELGFDSTGIDVDQKKQLPKKQKQFMKKHGDPSIAKINAFSFGGDVMVKKEFAKEIKTIGDNELKSRVQQPSSIHSTSYRDILIIPWAHSSAIRNSIEILNNPEKYKDNWRWRVAEEMKRRWYNKYDITYDEMFDQYVSYNDSGIKRMLQQRGIEFTDELGDGREPNFAPLVTQEVTKGPDGEPFDPRSAQVWKMNNESVFKKFDNLPLEEQINIINKVSKDKIDKIYEASKDIPSGQHLWNVAYKDGSNKEVMASSPYGVYLQLAPGVRYPEKQKKALGIKSIKKVRQPNRKPKGSFGFNNKGFTKDQRDLKKAKDIEFNKDPDSYVHDRNRVGVEESVPDFKQVDTINRLMADHFPVGDLKKQMLAYQAIPVPAMLDHFRQLRAEAGDDACARNILQMFVGVLPDETKAKIKMTEWSKQHVTKLINEYTDLGVEKDAIIKTISGLDASNEQHANILDRIYKLLNSDHIGKTLDKAFSFPLMDEPLSDKQKLKVIQDVTRIIGGLDSDYGTISGFITRLEKQGTVVNIKELNKPINSFQAVFGDDISISAFRALTSYGVGVNQKGPGEYALACLSNQISLAVGEGDLEIKGIGKVELKAATSSTGGRIGYGGGSQKAKRAVIDKYAEYIPTIMSSIGGQGGSLGWTKFINGLNVDLPATDVNNQKVRKAIAQELFTMDMEGYAGPLCDAIATQTDIIQLENVYLTQNFLWYKDRDDFDGLLLISIPNMKTAMIKNEKDLIAFRRSGHSMSTSISIIPTQAGAGREQWAQLSLNKGVL